MTESSQDRLKEYSTKASAADVEVINSKLSGMRRGSIARIWGDVQALWGMATDSQAAWTSKAIAIGALLYLVSPFDAIPDVIPILGLTDDGGVILAAVGMLCSELVRYRQRQDSVKTIPDSVPPTQRLRLPRWP